MFNNILLAISNLLASSKLLNLFLHSSCSKVKAGVEGRGEGEFEDEDELLPTGIGLLDGGEGLLSPSINKVNLLGKYTKPSFI